MNASYQVRFLPGAIRDLQRLDRSIGARILQRVRWLAENVGAIKPKRLQGDLAGLCKLRDGDYRILYQVLRGEKTVIIHYVGHRRDVYRRR
jgi:mRNA interferase RelE/StbE